MNGDIQKFDVETSFARVEITVRAGSLLSLAFAGKTPGTKQVVPMEFTGLAGRLVKYFEGRYDNFNDVSLDLTAATPFQVKVWEAARLIPYGTTRSYRWIAEQIGRPNAARAVGQALGSNPLPVIVPCHRVVAGDGTDGGYSGGIEMKRRLLRLEGSR